MAEKKLRWQAKDIDLHEFMEFIRDMGAASIKEIKDHFRTDSASVRKAMGFLLYHDKIWILSYGHGIYLTENTGKKGAPRVASLRRQANAMSKRKNFTTPKAKKPKLSESELKILQSEMRREAERRAEFDGM